MKTAKIARRYALVLSLALTLSLLAACSYTEVHGVYVEVSPAETVLTLDGERLELRPGGVYRLSLTEGKHTLMYGDTGSGTTFYVPQTEELYIFRD